jgi:hypothetical protein
MKIKVLGNEIELQGVELPKCGARAPLIVVAVVIGLGLLWGTAYQIEPEEAGVVLRLGRYVRTTDPGLRFKIPIVEQVLKVPVESQLKQEFGFRTVTPGVRSDFTTEGFAGESLMLTGDLNVAVVEWIVQYRVSDPYSAVTAPAIRMTGSAEQIVWAERIRAEVNTEFDRVRVVLESRAGQQSARTRTRAIIGILEEKRAEVMKHDRAGYFIHDWQELRGQVRRMILDDPRYRVIQT